MTTAPVSKIGVLGLGSIGIRHAGLLLARRLDVVGYDPSPERVERLTALGGRHGSRAAVIGDCDAVLIASPNERHLVDLSDALEAGKPALVEKPLGHDITEARRLIGLAESRGIVVSAVYNLRYRTVVQRVREWMSEEVLGEPVAARFLCGSFLPHWRPGQDYSTGYAAESTTGGVIFDVIHEFDLATHLLGPGRVESAAAVHSGLLNIDSEDCAVIVLRHDHGVLSTLHLDYLRRPAQRSIEFLGREGILSADLRRGEATVTTNNGSVLRQHSEVIDRDAEYQWQHEDFLSALANDREPACSGRTALDSLELVIEARRMAGLPSPAPRVATLCAGDGR